MSHAPTLTLYQNADFTLGVRWRVGGVAQEMSEVVFTLGSTPPLVAEVGSGVTLGNVGNEHRALVSIDKADIADVAEGPYDYDIVGTRTSDGKEQMLARGQAVVIAGAGS